MGKRAFASNSKSVPAAAAAAGHSSVCLLCTFVLITTPAAAGSSPLPSSSIAHRLRVLPLDAHDASYSTVAAAAVEAMKKQNKQTRKQQRKKRKEQQENAAGEQDGRVLYISVFFDPLTHELWIACPDLLEVFDVNDTGYQWEQLLYARTQLTHTHVPSHAQHQSKCSEAHRCLGVRVVRAAL
jgi:hypothetical protein